VVKQFCRKKVLTESKNKSNNLTYEREGRLGRAKKDNNILKLILALI